MTPVEGDYPLSERVKGFASWAKNARLFDRTTIAQWTADITGDAEFSELYAKCSDYTMTSPERMFALHTAVNYVVDNGIEGDIVEAGVWRGGSTMMAALSLLQRGDNARKLWLYDTFEGMSEPTDIDKAFDGESAQTQYETIEGWCEANLDDVQTNLGLTDYPADKITYVEGKVEDTIPAKGIPERIALLRLDTDWYESTKVELEHLYPLLESGGVLIIDDYGHWQGARQAVDEYFAENNIKLLLNRIDYTGRIAVKP
jgi:hypothetical protein